MRIQHNIMAMSAYRNYTNNVSAMKKNLEKLSSGYKINRAGDDAAGLAISEKMRAQITGLETAQKNAKDGISLVQTAEGALTEVHDMLNKMVQLATQSANGTYDDALDRDQMQKELDQLRTEINRIADSSNFNGIQLLDGSMSRSTTGMIEETLTNYVAASPNYTNASGVLTWASSSTAWVTNATGTPTASNCHLHTVSAEPAIGSFTIDFGRMTVDSTSTATGAKANAKFKILGATFAVSAATGERTLTATQIAAKIASGSCGYLYITKTGTAKIAKASATSITAKALYFKASVGTGSKANQVTFKPAVVCLKSTSGTSVKTALMGSTVASTKGKVINSVSDLSALTAAQASKTFNFTFEASPGTSNHITGWNTVGPVQYTDTVTAGSQQFGQAVVTFNASQVTNGMKVLVGASGNQREIILWTSGTTAPASGSNVVNLTDKLANASATEAKRIIAQGIANAFNAAASNEGIEIGVNASNNLVVAEKLVKASDGTYKSIASSDVQKAMTKASTFKKLLSFQSVSTPTPATPMTKTLTVDTNKFYEGNSLKITDGTKTTEYVFTTASKADATDGSVKYVKIDGSNTAANLAAKISASNGNPSVTVDGGKVNITYTLGSTVTTATAANAALSYQITGRNGLKLQIGDTAADYNKLIVEIRDAHCDALGVTDENNQIVDGQSLANISIADQDSAAKAIDVIKAAINSVSDIRGTLGATQNRLDHTINNLSVMTENIQDAESTIRDVDIAEEMMAYTKNNILIQSAQAMLAQANQVPQGVLQLLG